VPISACEHIILALTGCRRLKLCIFIIVIVKYFAEAVKPERVYSISLIDVK
jgi:hypothetical protein